MIGIKWTGWDGSVWDLRTGPVRLTTGGIEGLLSLKFDSFTRDSAARDGQRFQGWRAQPRDVFLPVLIMRQPTEDKWLEVDRAWWKTMQPGRIGTISVTTGDGNTRHLDVRFIDDGNHAYAQDPSIQRVAVWALKMIADNPYWYSKSEWGSRFTNAGVAVQFLGGGALDGDKTKGTPIVLGATYTTDASVLNNPGDINAWPIYTLRGPLTAFSIGVDGGVVSGTVGISSTQRLVIDTSPTMQTARLYNANGTYSNVLRSMTSFGFRPIRPGTDIKIAVNLSGAGSLDVTGVPRYFKAW